MPIIGPPGEEFDLNNAVMEELRALTKWFIRQDPTEVTLVGRVKVENDNGSHSWEDAAAKEPQWVKLIMPSPGTGIVQSEGGQEITHDFILVAEYNADIAIGDKWQDSHGNWWIIEGIDTANGYEVKAFGKNYQKNPAQR